MSKFDFNELAKEAVQTVYDPRAKRCWFLHNWSMWNLDTRFQIRRCIRCGRRQYKKLPMIVCEHQWSDVREGPLVQYGNEIGYYYDQRCSRCSKFRHIELRTGTSSDVS